MLELKNVSFAVNTDSGNLEIIDDVSFTVKDDSFTVITGPNGGGKSTIAKLIMGIEKPTSGKIIYNGEDITNLSVTERAKKGIGYAFQQPPRFKGLTVRRLLSLAAGSLAAGASALAGAGSATSLGAAGASAAGAGISDTAGAVGAAGAASATGAALAGAA